VAITMFNIPDADPWPDRGRADWIALRDQHFDNLIKLGQVRFPTTVDEVVTDGDFYFFRDDEVYVAIRVLKPGHTLQQLTDDFMLDSNANDLWNVVKSHEAQTGFVFEVGTAEEHGSFGTFQQAVKNNPLGVDWNNLEVSYTSTHGDQLLFRYDTDYSEDADGFIKIVPDMSINGQLREVDFNTWPLAESPVMTLKDGILRMEQGGEWAEVDWSGELPFIHGSHLNYYAVQIEFTDSVSGKPLEDLEVILQGGKYKTDSLGMIFIPKILEGTYKLNITDSRFVFTGKPEIEIRSDSLFNVQVRKLQLHSIQFHFTDSVSGKPLEGLELSLADSTYVSDSQGMIFIPELLEGNHSLVLPDQRFHITGNPVIEVRSDTTISVLVTKVPWLTFQVINRTSGASVYRAAVTVNDEPYYSNSSGYIKVGEFPSGPFHVSVSHGDYFPFSDTLLFSGDTTMILSLTPIRANVTFSFSDINGPVSGVKVTMSGSPQYTNSAGNAFFFSLPARENYSWSAEKSGYYTLQDSFHLETDTTLQITMDLATMVQKKTGDTHFLVYPNPAHDYLVIDREIPLVVPVKIDLVNVLGGSVYSAQDVTLPYTLRLKGINPGIYILKIHSPEGFANQIIVVK
jgi:hypothetical protein